MAKYLLKYWFEHGGICLWSANDNARSKYNYPIDNDKLPISKDLINELYALEEEYHSYLNWIYPLDPSPWTAKQKQDFIYRANMAYLKLVSELGSDFEVINEIDKCVEVSRMKYQCPCCEYYTYLISPKEDVGYICPVCFWENDTFLNSDTEPSSCNHGITLHEAKKNFAKFKACEYDMIPNVRPPKEDEMTDK